MGFCFRKSIKIAPGVKRARVCVNSKGQVTRTLSIPGTGISYVSADIFHSPSNTNHTNGSYDNNMQQHTPPPKKSLRILAYIIIPLIAALIHVNLFFVAIMVESIVHFLHMRNMPLSKSKRILSNSMTAFFFLFSMLATITGMRMPPAIETISIAEDAQTFDVNQEKTLSWAYTPENADISKLSAEVSNDTLAQIHVSENGELLLQTLSDEGSFDVTLRDGNVASNVVTFTVVDAKKEAERIAAEKAEAERIAAEKAEQQRIAAEKAEQQRIAAEKAEQQRIAAEKAEQQRIAAEKAEQQQAKQQSNSQTVYVTPTGKRYHYSSSCNGGSYSPSTLDDALARGLTPCKKCIG